MKDPQENDELLPAELLWADGGHASDVVLTALADGQQALVPLAVRVHVERCPSCMAHLGNSALLSLETRRLLVMANEVAKTAKDAARRPVPRLAMLFGLVAAVLGVVPGLVENGSPGPSREVSLLTRALASVATHLDADRSSTLGIAVTYLAAVCLVFAGLALARLSSRFTPKKEVS